MKGEIFQMCSIITAAKNALKTKTFIQYEPLGYEISTVFRFLPEKEGEKGEVVEGVDAWYARCAYNGLEDIKYMAPPVVKDRRILGFINTANNVILCFFPNDVIKIWIPHWVQNKEKRGWNILYQETLWEKHPAGKPSYQDNTAEFKQALTDIAQFAREIGYPGWAEVFEKSIAMLEGGFDYTADDEAMREKLKQLGRPMPVKKHLDLPPHNRDMFEAAANADVFGAMGSWNDSPAYSAKEEGREKEYHELSNRLYAQLVMATTYAVNEF